MGAPPSCHLRNVSGATGPKSSRNKCFVSDFLAMDTRMIGVEVHEAQLRLVGYAGSVFGSADVSRLRFSGTGAM